MRNLRKLSLIMIACIIALTSLIGCGAKKTSNSNVEATTKKSEELSDKQKSLVYGAILSSRNNMSFDELKATNDGIKECLKRDWDITDKKTAIDALEWLVQEGHRKEADEVYKIILEGKGGDYPELSKTIKLYNKAHDTMKEQLGFKDEVFNNIKTLSAWDTDRLVTVSRFAYTAGYISEEEAWNYINKAVSMAKASFNSWEEYFVSCAYGRAIAFDGDIDLLMPTGKALFKKSDSILKKCNFK